MKSETYEDITETAKLLRKAVLCDGGSAKDSSSPAGPCDIEEVILAELRIRRERLQCLLRMLDAQAQAEAEPAFITTPARGSRRSCKKRSFKSRTDLIC